MFLDTLFFEYILAKIETLWRKGSPTIVAAKVKCLLEQMESIKEEEFKSQYWKMQLRRNVVKAESVLQETKWMSDGERFNSPRLEMQLQEHVAKVELLLEEMELIRALEKVESPMSEAQLKEHVTKAE